MHKLKHYADKIEEVLAVTVLFYMLLILTYQIVLRFVFQNSNSWSEETARYLFVWFVYLTASLAVLKNAHIRIDAFLGLYPKAIVRGVVLLGYALFFFYCLAVTCYSSSFTWKIFQSEQVSLGLGTPMFLVWLALPVCHLLMSVRIIQRMYHVAFLGESVRAVDPEIVE